MLDELRQWAALEPERCRKLSTGHFLLCELKPDDRRYWRVGADVDSLSLAKLEASLRAAVATRGLLFKVENTREGSYHATVLDPETGSYASGKGAEAAVALLQAYTAWLAIEQKAEAIGGVA